MAPDDETLALRAQLARRTDELAILTRFSAEIGGTLDLQTLLGTILAAMDEFFRFEHSMVLLHDAAREVLVVAASRGYPEAGVGAEVPMGKGVIGVVAKRRSVVRMGNVDFQRAYLQAAAPQASTDGLPLRLPGLPDVTSVVAIPLIKRDELIGVFQVESRLPAAFDDADMTLLEAVASQAAVAIQNARYHDAERRRLQELQAANLSLTEWNQSSSRFVPHEFLAILGKERLPDVRRGDHVELEMSTFFSDVRDYTALVEGQGAEQNFAFINEYLTYMEAPIEAHQGFIDSYRGDGIMALFAGPADDAVGAAVDSLRALGRLNELRTARGDPSIRLGIGIDTGHLMLGTIGGEMRLSAGVIGDSANTASRVEGLTRRYGASVLVSERTRARCQDAARYRMRVIDRVRPVGKTGAILIYELLEGLPDEELGGKLASLEAFEQGVELYRAGQPNDALVRFASSLKAFPADRAAQLYIGRCWQLIENGVPDGWDGVMSMTSK